VSKIMPELAKLTNCHSQRVILFRNGVCPAWKDFVAGLGYGDFRLIAFKMGWKMAAATAKKVRLLHKFGFRVLVGVVDTDWGLRNTNANGGNFFFISATCTLINIHKYPAGSRQRCQD